MRHRLRPIKRYGSIACLMAAMLGAGAVNSARAHAEEPSDLREFHVGMSVSELPSSGYADFTCADDPSRAIAGWIMWRECPKDSRGQRAIRFKFDESANREGTKVAGHPVRLTLVLSDDAYATELVIETDPNARLFQRKRAFLLGRQAQDHYGLEGWLCAQEPAVGDEAPIGGVWLKEECSKHLATRTVNVKMDHYGVNKADAGTFVSKTHISIVQSK